jgi:hypothetical protein
MQHGSLSACHAVEVHHKQFAADETFLQPTMVCSSSLSPALAMFNSWPAGWHLAWVRITNLGTGATALFPCNQWLSKGEGDKKIERLLDAEVRVWGVGVEQVRGRSKARGHARMAWSSGTIMSL